MASIGALVAHLKVDRQGWQSNLKKGRGDLSSFVGGAIKTLAPLAAAVGAALAGRASINAAREQIKSEQKLQAVLKATGGAAGLSAKEIQNYAAQLQGSTNFGDELTINAAAVLATFKEIKGNTFKDALKVGQDMSAVLGTDLNGSMIQLGKALNDPIRGITALSRVGVSFTEQQKEQIKTLQESGDIMGAQKVILDELNSEFGGAASALADPAIQAQNTLGDIAEIVGFVLKPALDEVFKLFVDSAAPITDNADSYKDLGASIGSMVRTGLTPLFSTLKQGLGIITWVTDKIAYGFRNGADEGMIALIDLSLAVYDLVPGTETAMEQVAGFLVATWEGGKAAFGAFVQNVKGGFMEMLNAGEAVVAAIKAAFDALVSGENPLKAFTNAFTETLAEQQDVQGGGNVVDVFNDTFAKTKKDVEEGFASSGGLSGGLREQQKELRAAIERREAAFALKKQQEAERLAAVPTQPQTSGPQVQRTRRADNAINRGIEAGSIAAVESIVKATAGGKNTTEEKSEQHLDKIKGYAERTVDGISKMTRTIANRKTPAVGRI